MGLFSIQRDKKAGLPWIELTSEEQLKKVLENSLEKPVLLFKHSTRCNISAMALSRFEQKWTSGNELCDLYYLDLIQFRPVSNEIEALTGIMHQSPQVIVMHGNDVVYTETHSAIDAQEIEESLKKLAK